jgi:septal ring factor EnvC (AmiA/AmiB activator)
MAPKNTKQLTRLEGISEKVTAWTGSVTSVIVHSILFVAIFGLRFFGFQTDEILLILTTLVSLEAIYLAIFIQMTVNRNTESLEEVEEDIEEINEELGEVGEDLEGLEKNVEEISEDIEEISGDIDKIQEEDRKDDELDEKTKSSLEKIEVVLHKVLADIESIKASHRH